MPLTVGMGARYRDKDEDGRLIVIYNHIGVLKS